MILIKKIADLHKWIDTQRKTDSKLGFVPTMGALHKGHLSLVEYSGKDNDQTICSIFVNPTQFNDPGDFQQYPVTLEADITLLEAAGCTVLFLPAVEEMYPNGLKASQFYDLGFLETVLEGKFRPGHFQGVCMVVHRLLDIVRPDHLYLGQKDYQQCMVIEKLVSLIGMKETIKVHVCPTLREKDGLAMSSRNMRLSEAERAKAVTIYRTLSYIKERIQPGDTGPILTAGRAMLANAGFRTDYLEIADAGSLAPLSVWNGKQDLVVLAAAFLNNIRLIDNMVLQQKNSTD
jgi:pantoate--beta-alanine ligase